MECVSTRWMVGVYNPVLVEIAILMSACGRIVRLGLDCAEFGGDGVMDERRRGHWSIALESVLSRKGRYVRRVNWYEDETDCEGAGWRGEL